jgi:hypothetical protein
MEKIKIEVFPKGYDVPWWSRIAKLVELFGEFADNGDVILNCSLRKQKFLKPSINADFEDDSKSNVERHFVKVFGYSTFINPETYEGKYVRKSEQNGLHDGVIFTEPQKRKPGYVYQRLIETTKDWKQYRERAFIFGCKIKFTEHRTQKDYFETTETVMELRDPNDWFTKKEIGLINKFCRSIGLEYGELDILIENELLYVLDANNRPGGFYLANLESSKPFFKQLSDELLKMIKRKL